MEYIFVSAFSNVKAPNSRIGTMISIVGEKAVAITTDFNHGKKRYYETGEADEQNQILLHVPSYDSNLCFKRIWSHIVFAWKVKKCLKGLDELPKAIYCSMPTSTTSYVCARYCKNQGVKFVIDVIDLWPDSLLPLVKGKALINTILYPWTYLTRYAYRHADVIIGESEKYAYEAKKYNSTAPVYPVYLGIDMSIIKKVKAETPIRLEKPLGEIWIAYAGSLGESYDFNAILETMNSIHDKYKYKLWFIGDGVRRDEIASYVNANGVKAEITGFLPYEQLLGYLSYCDIAINIFRKNTKVVYSYKFNDYVAMDCFVLNSLEGETAQIVKEYKIGLNFDFDDHPLKEVMKDTLDHWEMYSSWKENCRRLIDEKLDKKKIYPIVKEIFNS